jgi:hypothetical protein
MGRGNGRKEEGTGGNRFGMEMVWKIRIRR